MANTATYRCPPVHQFPPAADCTDDDLLDIAARMVARPGAIHELMDSGQHQLALCQLIERQDLAMQQLREQLQAQQMLRTAALDDVNDLKRKHAALAEENRTLRIQAGLTTACLTITGRNPADLSAEWAAEDRRERKAMQRIEADRQCAAAIGSLTDRQRAMTVEIVDCVIERAQVRRICIEPVHERFAEVLEYRAERLARGSSVGEAYADFGADDRTVVVQMETIA